MENFVAPAVIAGTVVGLGIGIVKAIKGDADFAGVIWDTALGITAGVATSGLTILQLKINNALKQEQIKIEQKLPAQPEKLKSKITIGDTTYQTNEQSIDF